MVTHAGADSNMSIAYFSLTINDKKKIIKAEKNYCRVFFDRPYIFCKTSIKKQWPYKEIRIIDLKEATD